MWVKKYWPKQKMLDGRIPNCQVLDFWAWKCFSKLYYCTDNIIFKHLICQRWSLWVTKYFEVFRKGMCRLNRELGIMSTAIGTNFTTMNKIKIPWTREEKGLAISSGKELVPGENMIKAFSRCLGVNPSMEETLKQFN